MVSLSDRKSKLTFAVNTMVREKGKLRPVVVSPFPAYLQLRLKGCKRTLNLDYEFLYQTACKLEAARLRAERKARRAVR
jgi:hypothetical protein